MIKESLEGMVYKVKVFGVTLLSAIQLAPPLFASPNLQPRSIDVYVQDALFNQGTSGWQVQVLDKNTGEVLDAGVTDGSGYVKLDYDDVVGVEDEGVLPNDYRVSNQYPQPSNGVTKQDVQTPRPVDISAVFYDVKGEEVFRLDPKRVFSGVSTTMGVLNGLASGVYFQKTIITDDAGNEYNFIQKIALMKDGIGVSGVAGIQSGTKSFIPESQVYQKQESKTAGNVVLNKPGEIRDSVDIKIVAPNYEQYVKRVSVEDLVLNAEINQIPTTETKNVVGQQTNLQTGEPVKNANYTIEDENGNVLKTGQLNVQGQMNEQVQVNKWYWAPLDSTIRDIDTIKAILSKDLYNQKTYTKAVSSQIDVSGQMEHQGRTWTDSWKTFDENGDPISSTYEFKIKDLAWMFTTQTDGLVHIAATEFYDSQPDSASFKQVDAQYSGYLFLRKPNQLSTETNFAENDLSGPNGQMLDAVVALENLNSSSEKYLYSMRKYLPKGDGLVYEFPGDTLWLWFGGRNGLAMELWRPGPINTIVQAWPEGSPGDTLTQAKIDEMLQWDRNLRTGVLNNGDVIREYSEHVVYSQSDPAWNLPNQSVIKRDESGPLNAVLIDGEGYIYKTISRLRLNAGASSGFEEPFEARTGTDEMPPLNTPGVWMDPNNAGLPNAAAESTLKFMNLSTKAYKILK